MPSLRTPPVRTVLIDPAVPPPGSLTATFGTGLTVSGGAVVSVDFGTVPGKVAHGEKLVGAAPIDTSGAAPNDALRFDGAAFKPQAIAPGLASPLTTRGDLWVQGASGDARLALGASRTVLGSDGVDPGYRALDAFLPRADVDTTDDTWTTLATWTTTEAQGVLSVAFTVMVRKDDWTEGGVWRGSCAHRRDSGTYIAMGGVNWEPSSSENPALEVRVQEGAGGVHLQVKGVAATDYRWRVTFTRSSLEA